jgi:hypothetical protein
MRLDVTIGISFAEVQMAVETLIRHHDALRTRVVLSPL